MNKKDAETLEWVKDWRENLSLVDTRGEETANAMGVVADLIERQAALIERLTQSLTPQEVAAALNDMEFLCGKGWRPVKEGPVMEYYDRKTMQRIGSLVAESVAEKRLRAKGGAA